jgi:hypothetical protein
MTSGTVATLGAVGGAGAIGIDSDAGAAVMASALALSAARFLASFPNPPADKWLLPFLAFWDGFSAVDKSG